MSEKEKARRNVPRKFKRRPRVRISKLNRDHAAEIRELQERDRNKRLYPEPEPRGRYVP